MEEDIRNIEEMLEFKEDLIKYHAWVGTKVINSIEILLKRYKELEEYYEEQSEVNAKFIPTSVIEKELEELKNMEVSGVTFKTAVDFAIKILQEILEGRK